MDKQLVRTLVAARIHSGLITAAPLNSDVNPADVGAPKHYAEVAIAHADELLAQLEKKEAVTG